MLTGDETGHLKKRGRGSERERAWERDGVRESVSVHFDMACLPFTLAFLLKSCSWVLSPLLEEDRKRRENWFTPPQFAQYSTMQVAADMAVRKGRLQLGEGMPGVTDESHPPSLLGLAHGPQGEKWDDDCPTLARLNSPALLRYRKENRLEGLVEMKGQTMEREGEGQRERGERDKQGDRGRNAVRMKSADQQIRTPLTTPHSWKEEHYAAKRITLVGIGHVQRIRKKWGRTGESVCIPSHCPLLSLAFLLCHEG